VIERQESWTDMLTGVAGEFESFDPSRDEIQSREVSLFIGGSEYVLDGVANPAGHGQVALFVALSAARGVLIDEIVHPAQSAKALGLKKREAILFLRNRLKTLNILLGQVPEAVSLSIHNQAQPEDVSYAVPR
jgi:hypothetical protein